MRYTEDIHYKRLVPGVGAAMAQTARTSTMKMFKNIELLEIRESKECGRWAYEANTKVYNVRERNEGEGMGSNKGWQWTLFFPRPASWRSHHAGFSVPWRRERPQKR